MAISDSAKILLQYLLPKHPISLLAGKLAEVRKPWIKNYLIQQFAKAYGIDMSIAIEPDLNQYACFNDFFTRAIDLKHRPIDGDPNGMCSPVDGAISQFGSIESGRIIQAKNHHYSVLEILGDEPESARYFEQGEFCTIYLAPKDYHRIHMPCTGKLLSMTHVPGQLFSVNPLTARNVPKLFARNERVVAIFDTDFGKMAMILVGATIVGSIETLWAGTITPPTRKQVKHWDYSDQTIKLEKGQEMGRFKLGSTVILLMENRQWQWPDSIQPQSDVTLGQALLKTS